MAIRTTSLLVQGILGSDYDGERDLTPYIATANSLVNRLVVCASSRSYSFSSDDLELIERWLSAHCYCAMDKPYSSRSTQGASGSFQNQTGQGLEGTTYGLMALRLDYSGCLRIVDKAQRAHLDWIGKPASEQIPLDQRD